MRRIGVLLALGGALVASVGAATAAAPAPMKFRVMSFSSSTQLAYGGQTVANLQRVDGTVSVTAVKSVGKNNGTGSLSARGGKVKVLLTARTKERATIGERSAQTTPYSEQQCAKTLSKKMSGGVVLTRLSGNRIRVGWAFPQANAVTCPGPSGVGKALLPKMSRVYPAARFSTPRVRLSLAGSAPFTRGKYEGTYRWTAALTLARVVPS